MKKLSQTLIKIKKRLNQNLEKKNVKNNKISIPIFFHLEHY